MLQNISININKRAWLAINIFIPDKLMPFFFIMTHGTWIGTQLLSYSSSSVYSSCTHQCHTNQQMLSAIGPGSSKCQCIVTIMKYWYLVNKMCITKLVTYIVHFYRSLIGLLLVTIVSPTLHIRWFSKSSCTPINLLLTSAKTSYLVFAQIGIRTSYWFFRNDSLSTWQIAAW